ncbi:MAG: hypothetical protein GY928_03395 [Colwellia sp.]|nr:hypothetical protein [Colwellia sp.]
MCQFLATIDWLKLLQTLAALFTAYIAYRAVNTWKYQSKTKKQTDFLDELTDAVHEYIQALSRPISLLKSIYIGFESHRNLAPLPEHDKYSHIIAYIKSRGAEDSKAMWEFLNSCSSLVAKIESLVTRGQVYDYKNYSTCQHSIDMLLWQHKRIQVVALMIRSPTLNWKNPKVIKSIENMLTVQPTDIEEHLSKYSLNFIQFVNENYKDIYAGT